MFTDRHGLLLSTASQAAADAYREGIDLVLSAWPGAAAALDRAVALDPEFALAHIARGRVHQMHAEVAEAKAASGRARVLGARASAREQAHIHVLASAIDGQAALAIGAAEQHVEAHPRDCLVLSLLLGAFGLYAFSGRADHDAARVAVCERHARHYGQDWWFLTYLGWSHTEAGNAGAGRILAEQALGLRPANANAAHALAHALFEQGEWVAGDAFLEGWLPGYDRNGILNGHLAWHMALHALDAGDTDRALKLYDDRIRPAVSQAAPLNAFTDGASLLWRVGLSGGADLGARWIEIATFAALKFPRAGLAFADVHHALSTPAASSAASQLERLAQLQALGGEDRLPAGHVVIDLYRGLHAHALGDFAAAIRHLEPALGDAVRIGGSHAQRELCEDTLIVAYMRTGANAKACALIDRRLHRRPSLRDAAWRAQTMVPDAR